MTGVAREASVHEDDAGEADMAAARSGAGLRPIVRIFRQPLAAILALQTGLSLALIWSNTAYIDEAHYLWVGHLVLGAWVHGTPRPAIITSRGLSGSPLIYPPIGALADNMAGLAGARILSMLFMLGATVLLYSATSTIINRRTALFASALWGLSEPALRLAFATYDPLSVFLTALSAWLIVQAPYRRHPIVLAVLSMFALALANATAYSGILIDPVIIAFAFLVWWPRMGSGRALAYSAGFAAALVGGFVLVMFATGSWAGTGTIFNRQSHDRESLTLVLSEIWGYTGFLAILALVGVLIAVRLETRQRALYIAVLWLAVLAVPAAQIHYGTAWSADKHVAYGLWFAAMAGGYACARLVSLPSEARGDLQLPGRENQPARPVSRGGRHGQARSREHTDQVRAKSATSSRRTRIVAACCAVAIIYPAASGFTAAWQRYHLWQNSTAFVSTLRPILARAPAGLIFIPGHEANIAQYYLPQGRNWQRWSEALAPNPSGLPPGSQWRTHYERLVGRGRYAVIALFYRITVRRSAGKSASHDERRTVEPPTLLTLRSANPNEPGVRALTRVLEENRHYRLEASGPYDLDEASGTHVYAVFAIWVRVD
jgi:hypothetical protein